MQMMKNALGVGSKSGKSGTSGVTSRTSSSSSSSSSNVAEGERGMAVPKQNVAVAMPEVAAGVGTAVYSDAQIKSREAQMPVTDVVSETVVGKDYNMVTQVVDVPVTKMEKETVQEPEVQMRTEKQMMPKTITEKVPVTEKETVMRSEQVQREEIVLETRDVEKPVTVMKPVFTEIPTVRTREVMVARPHEVMKTVKVVRPENVIKHVPILKPVQRTKMVKVMRPVQVKKTITVEVPVPTSKKVNITQPEIREEKIDIQVPHTEKRHVTHKEAVTVIRLAGAEKIDLHTSGMQTAHSGRTDAEFEDAISRANASRDWATIPVGLPFTELVDRAKNLEVTGLHTEQTNVRRSWMQPIQYKQLNYKMERREETVIQTEMKEYEEEVIETVMEEAFMDMEVSIMHEVEEEWPVSKEHQEAVQTSEVFLDPEQAMVPEIGMKTVQEDVPRTVVKTETIQHPETVERTVMVDQAREIMQEVAVERPVEVMRDVVIEKPVTTYERREIAVPQAMAKDVTVQGVRERTEAAPDQQATYSQGAVNYRTAETVMKPTAVAGNVVVGENVAVAEVEREGLVEEAERRAMGLTQQDGVYTAGVEMHKGFAKNRGTDLTGVAPAAAITPDAVLPEGIRAPEVAVGADGQLVAPEYMDDVRGKMGGKGMIDGQVVGVTEYRSESVEGDKYGSGKYSTGTFDPSVRIIRPFCTLTAEEAVKDERFLRILAVIGHETRSKGEYERTVEYERSVESGRHGVPPMYGQTTEGSLTGSNPSPTYTPATVGFDATSSGSSSGTHKKKGLLGRVKDKVEKVMH